VSQGLQVPDRPSDTAAMRLEMRHITKNFGGVHALRAVPFSARAGEVHALCGENGAGKSTLMKILAGAITDYDGEILLHGQPVRFAGTRAAEDAGIRIIYQELNLVPQLNAADNIFLGREKTWGGFIGWLDNRTMETQAKQLFDRLGAAISPRAKVADLRIGDQQMVEIAKALAFDAAILIMDEPTSALSDSEVARLFRVIADLRKAGTTVLYISHKMNEVFTLADWVTVLRDGQYVASAARGETSSDQVIRWMVGREIAALHYEKHPLGSQAVLEVESLSLASPTGSGRPSLRDITFSVAAGEVVGIAGLLGAGRTELLEAIYGASPLPPAGAIRFGGRPVRFAHPDEAIRCGIAMVTEDRKTLGVFDRMTVAENITLRRLPDLTVGPFIDPRAESRAVGWALKELSIKAAGGDAPITSLSGGNQQNCIVARWLLVEPRLFLLDEPTRGIDVGAKAEIYHLIRKLAALGRAIIMTSSELPELLTVADRILVLCEGRLTAQIPRVQATEEAIMQAATQFLDRARASSGF
jgi:ABC-type sugar transport system ATPase subunit